MSRLGGKGFWRALALAAVFAAGFSASATAEVCSAAKRTVANKALVLDSVQQAAAISSVFPWGPPTATGAIEHERVLVQNDYVIDYDDDLVGPVWSADIIGVKPLGGGRIDCFRADPRLKPESASGPSDYDEPIFDQGHMVPNADMTFSDIAIMNTFVMSNMSPQFCQFNRGVWQILETLVRGWGTSGSAVYALNGAVFDRDGDGLRDPDAAAVRMVSRNRKTRVAVPSMYFKVLARRRSDGSLETLTILLPHNQTDVRNPEAVAYLDAHVSNLAAVEALTGLHFFPDLAGPRAEAPHLWATNGIAFGTLVAAPCRKTDGASLSGSDPKRYSLP